MFQGIEIRVVYYDNDLVELEVIASNSQFSGVAKVYCQHTDAQHMGKGLSGFPVGQSDDREFELGSFAPEYAGGGVRLEFHCLDAACHAYSVVTLRADAHESRFGRSETTTLCIPVEPVDIDRFVKQLVDLPIEVGAAAQLRMAT